MLFNDQDPEDFDFSVEIFKRDFARTGTSEFKLRGVISLDSHNPTGTACRKTTIITTNYTILSMKFFHHDVSTIHASVFGSDYYFQ